MLFIVYLFFINKANSRSVFNTGRHDRAIELRNSSIIDDFNTGLESVSLRVFFFKKKHTRNYIILSFFGIKRKMAPRYKSMILSCPKQTLLSCPFFSFRTGRSEGRLSSESRTAFWPYWYVFLLMAPKPSMRPHHFLLTFPTLNSWLKSSS